LEKISAVTLYYILKTLQDNYKIDTKKLLIDIGVDSDIFEKENSYVDSSKVKLLFKKAAQLSKDPCLALNLGQSSSPESIGLLGYMLTNAASIKEMFEKICHFSILIGRNLMFKFTDDGTRYKLSVHMHHNPLIPIPRYQSEIHCSALISLIRQLSGINVLPVKASFQHPKVEILDEYIKLFGKSIYFDSYENALYFTKDELNAPLENAYPGLLKYFETQAEKIIEDLYDDNWNARVKKTILLKLGNEDVDIEAIAVELDISVRMLQKHLQNEGVIYSKLLEDVRKKLAKYYLHNFSIDIGTIAIYLGYNDVSSFSRSFKKCFGVSPQLYRKEIPYSMGHAALSYEI
jgi:AraC-like DNA-binding protein